MIGSSLKSLVVLLSLACMAIASPMSKASAQIKLERQAATIAKGLPKTWVKAVTENEIQGKLLFSEITISEPGNQDFEWATTAEKSEEGFWQLHHIGPSKRETTLLASGVTGSAQGGQFTIDLGQYLPPEPPKVAGIYHLRTIARTKAKVDKSATLSPGQAGTKIPAKVIGFWSPPVVITYAQPPPATQFEFPEVYRKATLVFDEFRLVEDQYGPGEEEYHIGGFIQELFKSSGQGGKFDRVGRHQKLGSYYWVMNPPYSKGLADNRWNFVLNTQKDDWPRRFVVGVSVIEEDDGDLIVDWKKGLNAMSKEFENGEVLKLSEEQIADYLSEYGLDGVGFFVDAAELIFSAVSGSAAAGPAVIATTVAAITAFYIAAAIMDAADDYYGTSAGMLTLTSNRVDEIHKLPGKSAGNTYKLEPQTLQFKGPSASVQAAAWDGIVEVTFHWEFSDRDVE